MTRRAAVIGNPLAGHGRGREAMARVAAALEQAGLHVEQLPTQRPRHAAELAARAVQAGHELLLAVGGDGTLQEVASGVLGSRPVPEHLVLAPVPAGTCNSFARDFGLSAATLDESIRRILDGRTRRVDAARISYGQSGDREVAYFVNVFGVGFMAQVADAANRRFRFLGGQSYNAAVFWRLAGLTAPLTRLEICDETSTRVQEERLILVGVSNSQWTGDGMWIAPRANPCDGKLDVLTLAPVSRLELIRLFPRIFTGDHLSHPAVQTTTAQRVTITPATPSPILADGEVFGTTPVTVEVLPGALVMAI